MRLTNLEILTDRIRFGLRLGATRRLRHRAFRYLLPPSETGLDETSNPLERLAARYRPRSRDWQLGMTSIAS